MASRTSRKQSKLSDVLDETWHGLFVCCCFLADHYYNASESPPTPCDLKCWPTFTPGTVCINNDVAVKTDATQHWRWPQARHRRSSLQRDLQEMSHAGEVACGTSPHLRNDLLVSTLDIVHRTQMILLCPRLLSGNSLLTPPEAGANVLLTVLFFLECVCVCAVGCYPIQNHTSSDEVFFYISF